MPETVAPPAPEAVPAVDPPAPAAAAEAAPAAVDGNGAQDVASLPEWAQKRLKHSDSDAAGNRVKLKEQTTAHQASLDAIAKALGLKSDDDPAAAAKTAAEERDAARKEAKAAKVETAIIRAALKNGASPDALADSLSFNGQVAALADGDDFAAKLEEAIKAAVEANPALKTAPAPPTKSGGPVGGGAPIPGQLSREDLADMKPDEINKAREDGRLNQVLGITK